MNNNKNSTIISKVDKNLPVAQLFNSMQNLGFELIFKIDTEETSKNYLFLNNNIGLCEISIYRGKISSIDLVINYASKKGKNGFDDKFSNASWNSSTGCPSGYGYSYKVGNLTVNCLDDALEDIQKKGRFIMPFAENKYLFSYNKLTEQQQQKYHQDGHTDTISATSWFFENLIDKKHLISMGDYSRYNDKNDVLCYWDDYIRWCDTKINKKDKKFYTTAKEIILTDKPIDELLEDSFIYHTTDLGHNFCHLMSLAQEPIKKQTLWNKLQTLNQEHQTSFMCQNDLNGYNPLLILLQHTNIRPTTDKEQHLEYFKRYLTIDKIEHSFINDKNSFFDCLTYSGSLDTKLKIPIVLALLDSHKGIPKFLLKKEKPFSYRQKVTDIIRGDDIYSYLPSDLSKLIQSYELSEKMRKELPQKEKVKNYKI